ncbi:MAG: hypothetical protein JRN06_03920 [Nitrososphaerota archaeon]|nr:hypothetical protein [Nitrososphaerota archaeon]MDG7023767.1 hypothetical protein [Nitrososphaerota archaeon]
MDSTEKENAFEYLVHRLEDLQMNARAIMIEVDRLSWKAEHVVLEGV